MRITRVVYRSRESTNNSIQHSYKWQKVAEEQEEDVDAVDWGEAEEEEEVPRRAAALSALSAVEAPSTPSVQHAIEIRFVQVMAPSAGGIPGWAVQPDVAQAMRMTCFPAHGGVATITEESSSAQSASAEIVPSAPSAGRGDSHVDGHGRVHTLSYEEWRASRDRGERRGTGGRFGSLRARRV